jgi:hypothetical protein
VKKLLPFLVLAGLLLAGELGRADDMVAIALTATCPVDGKPILVRVPLAVNDLGGRDSDGCRWAVAGDGRLVVLELREIVACPGCGVALYRGHLDALARLHPDPAVIASALADLAPADPAFPETIVARAVATYRALGLEPFGIHDDPDDFAGRLWLRAAWAVRERAIRDDAAAPVLKVIFAPRTAEESAQKLDDLEELATTPIALNTAAALEGSLNKLGPAIAALTSLAVEMPERRAEVEAVRAPLEQTRRTLRDLLVASLGSGAGLSPAQTALQIARAAHRAGNGPARERWIAKVLEGDVAPEVSAAAIRLHALACDEQWFEWDAATAFLKAAERATGERKNELLVLAADATRRRTDTLTTIDSEALTRDARVLAERASASQGEVARQAAFLLDRLRR